MSKDRKKKQIEFIGNEQKDKGSTAYSFTLSRIYMTLYVCDRVFQMIFFISKFQFLFGIKAGTESFGTIITKTNSMFYFDVWTVWGEYRGSWSRTVHAIVEKQRVFRHPICICTFSLGKNLSLTLKSSIDIVHNWKLSMKCFSARVLRCLPFIQLWCTNALPKWMQHLAFNAIWMCWFISLKKMQLINHSVKYKINDWHLDTNPILRF